MTHFTFTEPFDPAGPWDSETENTSAATVLRGDAAIERPPSPGFSLASQDEDILDADPDDDDEDEDDNDDDDDLEESEWEEVDDDDDLDDDFDDEDDEEDDEDEFEGEE